MEIYDRYKVLLAVTGIISIAGGLTAIMYIDALQAVIMIIGAFTLCLQCFSAANISSLTDFKQAYLNSTYDYRQLVGKFASWYRFKPVFSVTWCGSDPS